MRFKIHTRPAISSKRVADNLPILISADNLSLAFFLPSANVYAILPGGRFKSGLAKKVLACKKKEHRTNCNGMVHTLVLHEIIEIMSHIRARLNFKELWTFCLNRKEPGCQLSTCCSCILHECPTYSKLN